MDPSFRPWQTAFKWLTYGRREFAAATCDMGISAYKYKTRLILAIQRIQHSDVVQFYAVFCKIDRIPDLSVVGLLRFLYLSLQICSHECDNRTNEVFLCLNKTLGLVERKFDQHSCWGLSTSPCPGFIGSGRGWSRVWWKNPPLSLLLREPIYPFVTPGIEMSFCVRYLVLFALLWKIPHPFVFVCIFLPICIRICLVLCWGDNIPLLSCRGQPPPLWFLSE